MDAGHRGSKLRGAALEKCRMEEIKEEADVKREQVDEAQRTEARNGNQHKDSVPSHAQFILSHWHPRSRSYPYSRANTRAVQRFQMLDFLPSAQVILTFTRQNLPQFPSPSPEEMKVRLGLD